MTTHTCECESRAKNAQEDKARLYDQLEIIIEKHKNVKGPLIQVLHAAQELFGYLPEKAQVRIAKGLGIPFSEVHGVLSFYSFFTTVPKGEHTFRICLGTACYVRGGKQVLEKFEQELGIGVAETTSDRKFSLEINRCVGACGLAPGRHVRPRHIPACQAGQGPRDHRQVPGWSSKMSDNKNKLYRSHVLVCAGGGCVSCGCQEVADTITREIDRHGLAGEVKVVLTGCMGSCNLGPVAAVVPEGIFYQKLTPDGAKRIVEEHLLKGRPVAEVHATGPKTAARSTAPSTKCRSSSFRKRSCCETAALSTRAVSKSTWPATATPLLRRRSAR